MPRLELLASLLGYGASSLFGILAALALSASSYGEIMQIQSAVLLVVAMFSLRTFDLVFFLQKQFSIAPLASFHRAFAIESALAAVCLAVVLSLAFLGLAPTTHLQLSTTSIVIIAVLGSCTIFQGSTQALLRSLGADRRIAWADLTSAGVFMIAAGAVLLLGRGNAPFALVTWFVANAARPLVLLALALVSARAMHDQAAPAAAALPVGRQQLIRFLAGGQFTNLLKNNSVSVETLLVGRLGSNEAVALYRICRSLVNVATALLNVIYQRSFRALSKCDEGERADVKRRLDRQAVVVWACCLPLMIGGAFAFARLSPDPAYDPIEFTVVLVMIATLPTVLQQSVFAELSMTGNFTRIGFAYLVGLALLIAASFACAGFFSVELFTVLLLVTNSIRYLMLRTG